MVTLLVILFLTDIVLGFFVWNLLRKLEAVEENLDANPTVDILDINGDPVDGFTGLTSCLVTEGVYKVTINNLSSESLPCL